MKENHNEWFFNTIKNQVILPKAFSHEKVYMKPVLQTYSNILANVTSWGRHRGNNELALQHPPEKMCQSTVDHGCCLCDAQFILEDSKEAPFFSPQTNKISRSSGRHWEE